MTDLSAQYFALRERFISRLPDRLAKMRKCLAEIGEGHPEARISLHREAHSLVGAAGLHQLERLAQLARDLEQIASSSHIGDIELALELLDKQISHPVAEPQSITQSIIKVASIALVCQDEDELASQKSLLESAGHSVLAATRPDTLRRHLSEGAQVDLIVLGLQFDGDDKMGLELLQELKSKSPLRPVIVFSASHSMPTQLAAYMKGASAFIAKPVAADTLLDAVTVALIKCSSTSLKLLALCATNHQRALSGLANQAGFDLSIRSEIYSFLECLTETAWDGILLVDPCPEPGVQMLSALINGQSLERRVPLVVFNAKQLDTASASWLNQVVRSKLAEHVAVREALKRSKSQHYEHERQKLALDHHTIISIADKTGSLIETSNRMSELLGWPRTQLIGSHLWDEQQGGPPAEFDVQMVRHANENGIWQGEVSLANRQGNPLWFHSTLVPFFTPEGSTYRYMVIRSDITQQKLAEQAVALSKAKEIELAVKMQEALLVPPLPGCVGNVPLTSYFSTASGMGGDFHAMVEHTPGCFDLLIGDVMGKGLHAAIVGAAVKLELNRCLLDLKRTQALPSPACIVQALDERLRAKLQAFECFVTLVYLRCDSENALITHVGCGHPESLLFEGDHVSRLSNHHPPLGIVPLSESAETVTPWPPGSSVFMYTDGLTETVNHEGDILGDAALVDALAAATSRLRHPLSMAAAALEVASRHQGSNPQSDDWTLIALRHPLLSEKHFELPAQLSSLAPLRCTVREMARQTADDAVGDRAELVCSEVFSNIVRHGLDERQPPSTHVHVRVFGTPESVEVSFHYHGIPFQPVGEQLLPEPEALTEGGLGLRLIHSLSNSVSYENTHGLCSCSVLLSKDSPMDTLT